MAKLKTVRRDISGRVKLDKIPEPDLVLFHWSPSSNRSSIQRLGLVPGRLDATGEIGWRAPFICFSEDPNVAWALSAKRRPDVKSWDLWACNTSFQTSFKSWEIITDTFPKSGLPYIKEYRIYERIFKRDLDYVATRRK